MEKEKLGKREPLRKLEWLKLLFETPRLGIEKEPGLVIELEREYRSLQNQYFIMRR